MRNKLFNLILRVAYFIRPSNDYYDFGEEVVSIMVYRDRLHVGTRNSIYRKNKTNDKWKKVS